MTQDIFLNRRALHLRRDPARVVVRPFKPATEPRDFNPTDKTRANHIVDRVMALDATSVASLLAEVLENFVGRHRNLLAIFEERADEMEGAFAGHPRLTQEQRRLIGAYFLHEYSFEAAALFNPSIVPHPDQTGVPTGARRFVLSLRGGRWTCFLSHVSLWRRCGRWRCQRRFARATCVTKTFTSSTRTTFIAGMVATLS